MLGAGALQCVPQIRGLIAAHSADPETVLLRVFPVSCRREMLPKCGECPASP